MSIHERLDVRKGADGRVWRVTEPRLEQLQMHNHDELELNLVLKGEGLYVIGSRTVRLTPHALIWLFPSQAHLLSRATPDFTLWIVVFRSALVHRCSAYEPWSRLATTHPPETNVRRLSPTMSGQIDVLLRRLESEPDLTLLNAGLAYALLFAWSTFLSADMTPVEHDVHPAVERAAYLIRRNQAESIGNLPGVDRAAYPIESDEAVSIRELTRSAGLSQSRLSRLFKEQMRMSLIEYRNRQRIATFLDLYRPQGRRNITESALAAGFGSYARFHRVFSDTMGMGPVQYARSLRVAAEAGRLGR